MQMSRCGTKTRILAGPITPQKSYILKPPGVKLATFKQQCGYFQLLFEPLEDPLTMSYSYFYFTERSDRGAAEKIFLEGAELLSSVRGPQETIQSNWHWRFGSHDFDIRLTQSTAHGGMPTRIEYTDRQDKYKNYFSDTHVQWKQQNGRWVPVVINAASVEAYQFGNKPVQKQMLAKIDWLVGDEVTPEMLQCDSDDLRMPLMQKFGRTFEFVAGGETLSGDPWDRPEGLVIEMATKSSEMRKSKTNP